MIYQLARLTCRNYRRVYDHVQELAGVARARVELKAGLRVPDVKSFIVSKCTAGSAEYARCGGALPAAA